MIIKVVKTMYVIRARCTSRPHKKQKSDKVKQKLSGDIFVIYILCFIVLCNFV